MAKRIEALIQPELLVWARKSAGFTKEAAANKLKIKPSKLDDWETGRSRPTINQLRTLGNVYKRPIAVFYLSEVPKDFDALKDFRRFPGVTIFPQSNKLNLEVRLANYRREKALDLMRELDIKPRHFKYKIKITDDAEETGNKIRNILNISTKDQKAFSTDYEAFNNWRSAVETTGTLVFQSSGIDVSEMRGFSIGKFPLPVISVNSKDSPTGRTFTLLHEFAHLMLREGCICNLYETSKGPPEISRVEVFCNHAAGAALIPRDELFSIVGPKRSKDVWANSELSDIAKIFRTSKETVLRRLLICGFTTERFYKKKRKEYVAEYKEMGKIEKKGFVLPHQKSISNSGLTFTRLVINGYNNEKITSSDLSDYLDIRLKHLPKITSSLLAKSNKLRALS